MRYQHVVPSHQDWQFLRNGTRPSAPVSRQLISDITAYNTKQSKRALMRGELRWREGAEYPLSGRGVHWVGDLVLECDADIQNDSGEITFELVEGGRQFQCRVDVATGVAALSIDGESSLGEVKAETELRGAGRHRVRFANVDDQLRLWVDGDEVAFDAATTYEPLGNFMPTEADLLPAGISSRGVAMEIRRLRLFRDLYYIADETMYGDEPLADFDFSLPPFSLPPGTRPTASEMDMVIVATRPVVLLCRFSDNRVRAGRRRVSRPGRQQRGEPRRRLWAGERVGHWVRRTLLVGKALFILLAALGDRIPGTGIPFPFSRISNVLRVIR